MDLVGEEQLQDAFGELADDWTTERAYVVGTDKDYAEPVEFGSSAHTIRADDADALRFEDEGEVIYRVEVHHPGTPAQPFLRPAVRDVRNNLDRHLEKAQTADQAMKLIALDVERKAKKNAPVDTSDLKGSIRTERIR